MGLSFKSIATPFSALGSVAGSIGQGLGLSSGGGYDTGSALLSGIPFIGEGFAAQQQQNFASAQSAQQMAYQTQMSNTAHQRQAADMEKAGLNRILSAGAGASSPAGSAASGSALSGASSSANMLKSVYNKERQLAEENIKGVAANTKLAAEKENSEKVNQLASTQSAKESQAREAETRQREKNLKLQEEGLRQESEFQKKYGQEAQWIKLLTNSAGALGEGLGAVGMAKALLGKKKLGTATETEKRGGKTYHKSIDLY